MDRGPGPAWETGYHPSFQTLNFLTCAMGMLMPDGVAVMITETWRGLLFDYHPRDQQHQGVQSGEVTRWS